MLQQSDTDAVHIPNKPQAAPDKPQASHREEPGLNCQRMSDNVIRDASEKQMKGGKGKSDHLN